MSESRVSYHVSYEQVKRMLDFMERHADLANNDLAMAQGRHIAKKLWAELTAGLNKTHGGTKKSMNGWRRYWGDFRHKMRNKMLTARNRRADRLPVPLNRLERKAFQVLDPYFQRKERRAQEMRIIEVEKEEVAVVAGETSSSSSSSSSEEESQSCISDTDSDTDSSASAGQLIALDSTGAFSPNWLSRVEQKRADAELARARADEVYARSTADAAHAAQAQADALSCLARATTAQADALERIATVLDRTPHHMIDL